MDFRTRHRISPESNVASTNKNANVNLQCVPQSWLTFRDLWPRNGWDPFAYCVPPFGGHYVATTKVAICLVLFSFSLFFFVSVPCARLGWPSRQLLSARKYTVSYRVVSYCNLLSMTDSITCAIRRAAMYLGTHCNISSKKAFGYLFTDATSHSMPRPHRLVYFCVMVHLLFGY